MERIWHGLCFDCAERPAHVRNPAPLQPLFFGVIQSGLTSLIAAGIASFSLLGTGNFVGNWLVS
jgi:hypothetical protein